MRSKAGLPEERSTRWLRFASGTIGALALILFLAACHKEEKAAATAIRPVRTVTVEHYAGGERISLTGKIQPGHQPARGSRRDGRSLHPPVAFGPQVNTGS